MMRGRFDGPERQKRVTSIVGFTLEHHTQSAKMPCTPVHAKDLANTETGNAFDCIANTVTRYDGYCVV